MAKKLLTLSWGLPDPAGLLRALQGLGWEPVWVADMAGARQVLALQEVQAGLLLLGQGPPGEVRMPDSAQLEAVLTGVQSLQALEWVALCEVAALQSPHLRTLVLECFFDYHLCPPDWPEVARVLEHLSRRHALRRSQPQAPARAGPTGAAPWGMVGCSPALEVLRQALRKVAATQAPVLIGGESGSGKELAARAIHAGSERHAGPFVAVNCAAIAPSLIQSELFGYEKGAFTGATARKQGLIEAAHGGTLFLDEIGDLSLELQANLLRFLQERCIYRVGGLHSVAVDARIVAATHVQLHQAVAQGRFREDLFYRLNVLPIEVPPLRARREDVGLLAQHFFQLCVGARAVRLQGFAQNALVAMAAYDWPGNVRELYNRVQRAVVMSDGRWISAADLGLPTPERAGGIALEDARILAEREVIQTTLAKSGRNITHAARDLGVSRMTLYRLMDKHGIVP